MEQSHMDTHLFSSCSPASPLERQQKQVNKGTCQRHARFVDGKEQAERIILGGSREDRERQGTQNRWILGAGRAQQEASGLPGGLQDKVEFSPGLPDGWGLTHPMLPVLPRKQSHQTVVGLEASPLIPTGLSCSPDEGLYLK